MKKSELFFWFGRCAQVEEASFLEVNLMAQASTLGVSLLFGMLQALGSHQPSVLEEDEAFFNNGSNLVRRQPSWQRSGVLSQQSLRLRRFDSLVKRSPKLRFEPVSFLFLFYFSIEEEL